MTIIKKRMRDNLIDDSKLLRQNYYFFNSLESILDEYKKKGKDRNCMFVPNMSSEISYLLIRFRPVKASLKDLKNSFGGRGIFFVHFCIFTHSFTILLSRRKIEEMLFRNFSATNSFEAFFNFFSRILSLVLYKNIQNF